ncbi:response regulator [Sunxiuqinia indica]|uniref:response regulator n=1 Tax=Sunxiuqinia indica TaxID=2692584 RepID=UPI0021D01F90|nr:response regulator [Sunxiuqinia indica]
MGSTKNVPRILIVEDMPINIDLMKSILAKRDYQIVAAKNGKSAISKAKANRFDLILLDIILPDIDGFEVCREIKNDSVNIGTPIIFLTGQRDNDSLVTGFELGAVDYILKPFSEQELLARVNLHLTLSQTQRELKEAKEDAEQAAKEKAMFLANMSHEIRTPLNGIVGMIDILKGTELDEQQKEYVEIVDISSETLLMIINDILDFSKIEAGQITFERITFKLEREINEVKKLLNYKAEQKGLELIVEIDDSVPKMILGDPLRLKQILINLTNNAIKFTEAGFVKIKVKLDRNLGDKNRLRFEVIDSGIGISEENQTKLFKSFSQADTSTTRKFGGTGLGLAISKRLSGLMGGEIGVTSDEGNGSTFWFTAVLDIPKEISSKDDLDQIEVSREKSDKIVLNILLAEDNAINQKVAMLNIKQLGHHVELAHNGVVAVEMFAKKQFDFILMDIQMPGMDGMEATKAIRKIEQERNEQHPIPIIALTANMYKDDIKRFLDSGMNAHLGKPFKPDDLQDVIQKNVV